MKRVAIYARVALNTGVGNQSCETQLLDLREYCRARGWESLTEYVDEGVSGLKQRRPALDRLMPEVKARRVDVVVVAALDRLSRSVRHCVTCLELFRHVGVEFISLADEGLLGGSR